MAHIVFTTIRSLDALASATWHPGDNDSYANTQRAMPESDGIRLIGRQDKYGRVQLCYAASSRQDWTVVNAWHLTLARYFDKKLDQAPAGDTLRVFFEEIDSDDARYAAQQLIALECGINVTKEPHGELHKAVQQVQRGLRALGNPCGDWTFVPMFDSFEPQSVATT